MATTVLHEFPSSIVKLKGAKDQSCEVWLEFSQAVYEEMVDKMSHTHTHMDDGKKGYHKSSICHNVSGCPLDLTENTILDQPGL